MLKGSFFWRNTSLKPTFLWVFDASSVIGLLLFVLHMRSWTFFLALFIMISLSVLSYFGFTVPLLMRYLSYRLGGKSRPPRAWWHWERMNSNNF